jgi:palmitoyltransferase
VTLPYIFLYLSASTDPGFITPLTHPQHMSLYPYDHINYHPSISCSTCNLPKPARSKHCSLCNRCVARSDHHCIFINGCVGYGNTHWFILLLISTSTLVVAGAHLGIHYVAAVIQTTYPSFTPRGKGFAWRDYWNFWLWGLHQKPGAGGVTLLCVLSSLLVVALGVYTLYQVWAGITTNESGKWDDVKLDIEDEMLFMRPIDERRVRRRDVEPYVRWPVEAKIVAVSRDTMPAKDERELREIGVGPWRAVRSIHELENIYDIGFWRNIGDIFLPREMAERWISGF